MMPSETHRQKVTSSVSTRSMTATSSLVVWTPVMINRTDSAHATKPQESSNLLNMKSHHGNGRISVPVAGHFSN